MFRRSASGFTEYNGPLMVIPGSHRTYVTVEVTGSQATAVKRPPVHLAQLPEDLPVLTRGPVVCRASGHRGR